MQAFRILLAVTLGLFGMLLALPIVMFGLPFWLVVTLTRPLYRFLASRPNPWQELIEFEQIIGCKNKANLHAYALDSVNDAFQLTTDSQGWRGEASSIADSDIVVFGDSFAFGHAIDDAAFFAGRHDKVCIKAI